MIIHDNNINININIHSNTYSLRNLDVLLLLKFLLLLEILRSRSDIVFLAVKLADFLNLIL